MKKIPIVIGVCLIVVTGITLSLFLTSPYTVFHYEEAALDSIEKPVDIYLANFHDSFVSINFVQNESLLYDLDIESNETSPNFNVDFKEQESNFLLTLNRFDIDGTRWVNESVSIKRVNLKLSLSRQYSITIYSEGVLNTTVVYPSGVNIGGVSEFVYLAKGSLNLTIEEGVILDEGIFLIVLSTEYLELNVNLSNETEGRVVLSDLGFTHLFEWEGWFPDEEHPNVLQTAVDLPESFIHISATSRFSRVRLRAV